MFIHHCFHKFKFVVVVVVLILILNFFPCFQVAKKNQNNKSKGRQEKFDVHYAWKVSAFISRRKIKFEICLPSYFIEDMAQ